jgi:8-oxo-dGTP pyrophosphatase MutT (NUDIX family)
MNLQKFLKSDKEATRFFNLITALGSTQRFSKPCDAAFALVFSAHRGVLRVMINVENRRKHKVFGPPGGGIEPKYPRETDDKSGRLTAERETIEETGVDITRLRETRHITTFSIGSGIRYAVYFTSARLPNGDPWIKNNEVSAVCHMRFADIFSANLSDEKTVYTCDTHKLRLRDCFRKPLLNLWKMMHPE